MEKKAYYEDMAKYRHLSDRELYIRSLTSADELYGRTGNDYLAWPIPFVIGATSIGSSAEVSHYSEHLREKRRGSFCRHAVTMAHLTGPEADWYILCVISRIQSWKALFIK